MERYFGILTTTITTATVNKIERTTTGIKINSTDINSVDVNLWTRTVDDLARFPDKYNNRVIKRRIILLSESTTDNTLISSDGLILVINGLNITVVDLFENTNINYALVKPEDGKLLVNYILNIQPEHKRVFVISGKDQNNYLKTKYMKIFSDSVETHFRTDMDLDLETDYYGYYISNISSFTEEVNEFSLIKKQFYLIKVPEGTVIETSDLFESVSIDNTKLLWFKNLDVASGNKFIKLKFKNTSVNSGTIIIY